jgi:hypothetical protein
MMLRLWAEIAYLWVEHDIRATGRYMTRANRRANPAPATTTRFYVMSLRRLRFASVHGRARWKDDMEGCDVAMGNGRSGMEGRREQNPPYIANSPSTIVSPCHAS